MFFSFSNSLSVFFSKTMCIPFLFFWFTQNIIHHPLIFSQQVNGVTVSITFTKVKK